MIKQETKDKREINTELYQIALMEDIYGLLEEILSKLTTNDLDNQKRLKSILGQRLL